MVLMMPTIPLTSRMSYWGPFLGVWISEGGTDTERYQEACDETQPRQMVLTNSVTWFVYMCECTQVSFVGVLCLQVGVIALDALFSHMYPAWTIEYTSVGMCVCVCDRVCVCLYVHATWRPVTCHKIKIIPTLMRSNPGQTRTTAYSPQHHMHNQTQWANISRIWPGPNPALAIPLPPVEI